VNLNNNEFDLQSQEKSGLNLSTNTRANNPLNSLHQKTLCQGSGISLEMVELNFKSEYASEELSERLGLSSEIRTSNGFSMDCIYGGSYTLRLDEPYIDWEGNSRKYQRPKNSSPTVRFHHVTHKIATEIILTWSSNGRKFIDSLEGSKITSKMFWDYVKTDSSIPLFFTEGSKKAVKTLELGMPCLALDGLYSYKMGKDKAKKVYGDDYWKIQNTLDEKLKDIIWRGRKVYSAFDNDFHSEKRHSYSCNQKAVAEFCKNFSLLGAWVKVMDWDGLLDSDNNPVKGIDDVFVAFGADKVAEIRTSALSHSEFTYKHLNNWEALAIPIHYIDSGRVDGKLEGSLKVKENGDRDLYLSMRMLGIKAHHQLILIQSFKGSGKTEIMKALWYQNSQATSRRYNLVATHRILLGQELSSRSAQKFMDGIPGLSGVKEVELYRVPHIDEGIDASETKDIIMNIDSLHEFGKGRFDVTGWDKDKVFDIFMDEFEQLLMHLHTFDEIKVRNLIISNLKELLRICVKNGGRIFCFDADLSPISYKFIQEALKVDEVDETGSTKTHNLLKKEATHIVINKTKIPATKPLILHHDRDLMLAVAAKMISEKKRILILVCGQKEDSKYGTTVIEKELQRLFPTTSAIRIDSETTSSKGHPAHGCFAFINETLVEVQYAIISPSAGTGCDINSKSGKWDALFFIASGVLDVDATRQFMERLRDPYTPRHVYITTRSINNLPFGGAEYPGIIHSNISTQMKDIYNLNDLKEPEYFRELTNKDSKNYLADSIAASNHLMKDYRENLLARWLREGYYIEEWEYDQEEVNLNLGEAKDQAIEDYAKAIIEAEIYNEKTASLKEGIEKKSGDQFALTLNEKYGLQRFKIAEKLCCRTGDDQPYPLLVHELTVSQVTAYRDNQYNPCLQSYYLVVASSAEFKRYENNIIFGKREKGKQSFIDIIKRTRIVYKHRLEQIGFLPAFIRALNEDRVITVDEAKDILRKASNNNAARKRIKQDLGITIKTGKKKTTEKQLLNAIGQQLGYKVSVHNPSMRDMRGYKIEDTCSEIRQGIYTKRTKDYAEKILDETRKMLKEFKEVLAASISNNGESYHNTEVPQPQEITAKIDTLMEATEVAIKEVQQHITGENHESAQNVQPRNNKVLPIEAQIRSEESNKTLQPIQKNKKGETNGSSHSRTDSIVRGRASRAIDPRAVNNALKILKVAIQFDSSKPLTLHKNMGFVFDDITYSAEDCLREALSLLPMTGGKFELGDKLIEEVFPIETLIIKEDHSEF